MRCCPGRRKSKPPRLEGPLPATRTARSRSQGATNVGRNGGDQTCRSRCWGRTEVASLWKTRCYTRRCPVTQQFRSEVRAQEERKHPSTPNPYTNVHAHQLVTGSVASHTTGHQSASERNNTRIMGHRGEPGTACSVGQKPAYRRTPLTGRERTGESIETGGQRLPGAGGTVGDTGGSRGDD